MVALPLGAILCFFDLLAARIFARGELTIQCRFHHPLSHTSPQPSRPIFTRYRQPTVSEVESGRRAFVRETSFYRNTYAMVDATTPSLIHTHCSVLLVHRFHLLSSFVLFPCYQTCYHIASHDCHLGLGCPIDLTGITRSCSFTRCEESRNLASKCGRRRVIFRCEVTIVQESVLIINNN